MCPFLIPCGFLLGLSTTWELKSKSSTEAQMPPALAIEPQTPKDTALRMWGPSGWLGGCPLPPSLLHVPPSWSCVLGQRGQPSQEKRIGLQSRVYEQRRSLARSSKLEHGSETETGQMDANGCQGAKIRFSFCLTGGEQSLKMRMRIHVFHCTHTQHHHYPHHHLLHHHPSPPSSSERREIETGSSGGLGRAERDRRNTFCFPSGDSPRWRFHPGTSLEPTGCKGSWYRGKGRGGQHSPWPWHREEAPMFPTTHHHGKSHTLPWELPGEGGNSRWHT